VPRTGLSPEEMRDAALEAAETVIRRHGVERTRIVDIAAVVGVNHALLYRHFKDRAALIDAVSERWLSRLRQDLDGIALGAGRPGERIRHWLIALHRILSEKRRSDPELFRSYRQAHDEDRPLIGKHGTAVRWQLAKLVTEAMQSGALADANPLETAVSLFDATASFHHPALVDEHSGTDREAALVPLVDLLMRGLKAPA
jgi:AcrR family transcriptional regulator